MQVFFFCSNGFDQRYCVILNELRHRAEKQNKKKLVGKAGITDHYCALRISKLAYLLSADTKQWELLRSSHPGNSTPFYLCQARDYPREEDARKAAMKKVQSRVGIFGR
jgi:hypothetical protein